MMTSALTKTVSNQSMLNLPQNDNRIYMEAYKKDTQSSELNEQGTLDEENLRGQPTSLISRTTYGINRQEHGHYLPSTHVSSNLQSLI